MGSERLRPAQRVGGRRAARLRAARVGTGDARRGIAPGWVRLNGYTGARDITWGVNGFLALPKSSRDYESAGPVIQVSSSNALTGATLVHSGSATGAVIQRRWSR